jgi:hypothetical protein
MSDQKFTRLRLERAFKDQSLSKGSPCTILSPQAHKQEMCFIVIRLTNTCFRLTVSSRKFETWSVDQHLKFVETTPLCDPRIRNTVICGRLSLPLEWRWISMIEHNTAGL